MKFKDMQIGHSFTKDVSMFIKIQEVVPREETNRTTSGGYVLRYNTVIVTGPKDTKGLLVWFDGELEFN